MKKTRTRLWSLLLTVAMLLTMLPATALAAGKPFVEMTVGGMAAQYDDQQEFFAALQAAAGEIDVKLLDDVEIAGYIPVTENQIVTFDLNGHKLSTTTQPEDSSRHYYAINNYGTFTLLDTAGNGEISARGIQNLENGKMYIESGKIVSCDSNGGAAVWNEADLKISGGTFETVFVGSPNDSFGPGCLNNTGTALVTGGTFQSVNQRAYAIISTGELEITPAEEGAVTVSGAHGGLAVDSGVTVVNGGEYTSSDYYGLYVSNDGLGQDPEQALVTVNGGTFSGKEYSVWVGSDYNDPVNSTIEINGGVFTKPINAQKNTREGAIKVRGGTFATEVEEKYLAPGYVCTPSGESYIVEPLGQENATAMVTGDSEVTYFETLTDAIAAANDGETVTLLKDFTTTTGISGTIIIPADKEIILDLGGKTLTMKGGDEYRDGTIMDYTVYHKAALLNHGELTIQNGTITSSFPVSSILNTGVLNIASDAKLENTFGTYYKNNGYAPPCVYLIVNVGGDVTTAGTLTSVANNGIVTYGGTVSVSGGSISAPNAEAVCIDIFNREDNNTSAGADVTISGGELEAGSLVASTNNQKSGGEDGCNLTVTGGTLTAGTTTIYWPSSGTLIIGTEGSDQGPVLTSERGSAIEFCSGTLNIYGGELNGGTTQTSSDSIETEGLMGFMEKYPSGYYTVGDAVTIYARRGGGYVDNPLSVTIAGGEFSSAQNYGVRYLDYTEMEQGVSVSITGGSFSGGIGAVDAEFVPAAEQKFITGGTFSSEVDSSYLGANCVCEKQSDGTYRVGVPVTVKFFNDGTEVKTEKIFAGDTVTAPSVSKEGYVLESWVDETGAAVDLSQPVDSDLTLTAQWAIKTYTVTYAVDDVEQEETVSHGAKITYVPEKEGYAFAGWYLDETMTESWNMETDVVTSDITLYAKWNEIVTPEEQPEGVDEIQVAPSTPVIDDNNAPAGSAEVVEALQGGVEQEGVTEAAKDLASNSAYMAEIAAEAKTELELGDDKNVTLVVETSLNISVTDVKEGDSFTLDITPTYTITATADGKTTTIVEDEPLTVTKSVTLTIPLPKSFVDAAELFVHHLKNGRTYVYDGKVLNGKLSFLNPHGFSQFTISRTGPEASVDGVQYATLQEAVDAVENRGTITVHQSGLYAQVSGVKTFWVETDTGVEMPQLYAAPGYTLSKDGNKYTVRVRTIDDPDNDYELPTWDITVEDSDNGDVEVSPEEAKPTTTITITVTPDKGYAVAEVVVTDENGKEITVTDKGGNKYTFRMPNSDVTIEVTFQPVSGGAAGSDLTITAPTGWVNPFTDVAANAWYYDAVGYANANGLMGGTSATTFAPNGAMNRSMVWTVIARLAGQTISGANWAEDAKAWAVAQGVSDGTNPDGNVTREELVTMLYRYIGSPVMNVPELGLINSYPDAASVSDWAQNALAWALSRGIIDGRDGKLASGESVTRAEAATILARFHLLTK